MRGGGGICSIPLSLISYTLRAQRVLLHLNSMETACSFKCEDCVSDCFNCVRPFEELFMSAATGAEPQHGGLGPLRGPALGTGHEAQHLQRDQPGTDTAGPQAQAAGDRPIRVQVSLHHVTIRGELFVCLRVLKTKIFITKYLHVKQ